MAVSGYFVWFIFFSVLGWLFECTFCTVRSHHWQNRGFLYGPVCPIYGVGVVAAMIAFNELFPLLPDDGTSLPVWAVFLICAAASAVLEFVTSWVLEKLFHAVWWDYSNVPFNIQGRICPPCTCGFGIAGTVFIKLIFPLMSGISVISYPLLTEALSLVLAVFLGMDLALTVNSLMLLSQRVEEAADRFNDRMEGNVQLLRQGPEAVGDAVKASARDKGETAAIAAMLAADAAKKGFSERDKYHVRSIRAYRPRKRKRDQDDMPEKLRAFFSELQKRAGSPQERIVKKKEKKNKNEQGS